MLFVERRRNLMLVTAAHPSIIVTHEEASVRFSRKALRLGDTYTGREVERICLIRKLGMVAPEKGWGAVGTAYFLR